MHESQYLALPGPTAIPPRVLRAMSTPMVDHRGPVFKEILYEVTENVKKIMKTKNDVLTLTCSGSGGLEAAVVNFVSPGDKVLVASIGNFGERFRDIALKYGADVEFIDFGWGNAIDPQVIKKRLDEDNNHEIKAILLQHNETSTAVVNPVKEVSEAKGNHPALLIVDSVSGLGAADLQTDAWNLDVVIAGSQKAFMAPPGIAFVSVSERAWKVAEKNTNCKYYFDLISAKKFLEKGQTPFTPSVSVVYGIHEALQMMMDKGIDNIIKEHYYHRDIMRTALRAIGLSLTAADEIASPAVTAVNTPEGADAAVLLKELREKYNVVVAGGQGKLQGKTFRVGHLGFVQPLDLIAVIASIEMALANQGLKIELGKGVKAAQEMIMRGSGV